MLFIHVDQDFHVVYSICRCSQYLKILFHFLVIYTVANRRSANIFIFVPLTVTYPFSLFPMSLLLVLSNLIMINFDTALFMTWDFFCVSWMLLYSFHQFLKIFSYYFFKCVLFLASLGTLRLHTMSSSTLMVPFPPAFLLCFICAVCYYGFTFTCLFLCIV